MDDAIGTETIRTSIGNIVFRIPPGVETTTNSSHYQALISASIFNPETIITRKTTIASLSKTEQNKTRPGLSSSYKSSKQTSFERKSKGNLQSRTHRNNGGKNPIIFFPLPWYIYIERKRKKSDGTGNTVVVKLETKTNDLLSTKQLSTIFKDENKLKILIKGVKRRGF